MQTAGRWADPKMPAHYARAERWQNGSGGEVLLWEVSGQGAAIDTFARKRALLSGNPKRKRTGSPCKRVFCRFGVLGIREIKTSGVFCECFRNSAGWVGSRGF